MIGIKTKHFVFINQVLYPSEIIHSLGNSVSPEFTLFKELKAHDGACLAYEFIEGKNYFVTTGAEKRMGLWDTESNYRLRSLVETACPQLSALWIDYHRNLFTCGTNGYIFLCTTRNVQGTCTYGMWTRYWNFPLKLQSITSCQ